jgi:Uncharacterised nucleotidyltransferase
VYAEQLLLPIIYSKFSVVAFDGIGSDLLKEHFVFNWMQNEMTIRSFRVVLELFRAEGIDTIVLKGAALVSEKRLNDIAVRPFTDVDLLVRPDRYRDAIELLLANEWTSSSVDPIRHIDGHHSINLKSGMHGSVDLHREPLHRSHSDREDETFWSRSEFSKIGETSFRIPSVSDHIVTVIGHSWVGDSRACLDLFYLFRKASNEELKFAVDLLSRRNLILHGRRVVDQMKIFLPEADIQVAEMLQQVHPVLHEKVSDRLEYPSFVPENAAQWLRQIAYWMNRTQGDPVSQRLRTLRSFALFNTGTAGVLAASRVVIQSIRSGERTGARE